MGKTAIYPGSFDPVTNGHCDVVKRGLELFDKVIVAVAENGTKDPLFTIDERLEMLRETFQESSGVEVDSFDGLLVDYAETCQADAILRGLRAVSDFEYEFQIALMNQKLEPKIETFFMMPNVKYSYLSSKLVKEIFMLGGCLKDFVPTGVEKKFQEKFKEQHPKSNMI